AADPRRELTAHASRARVGLIPVDNAAAEDAEDVLIAKIAVASGNLRTIYVIGVDRGAGMTRRSHQGAAHEQRDNEDGTQGANLEFGHCIPPEGLVSSSCESLRSPARYWFSAFGGACVTGAPGHSFEPFVPISRPACLSREMS